MTERERESEKTTDGENEKVFFNEVGIFLAPGSHYPKELFHQPHLLFKSRASHNKRT